MAETMLAQAALPEAPDLGWVMRNQMQRSQGQYGMEVISDTVEHVFPQNRPACIIHFTAESVVSTAGAAEIYGNALSTITFPAGFPLYGEFTKITLVSGKAIAYLSRPSGLPSGNALP